MKGTQHVVWQYCEGGVAIANIQDDHYYCVFETPEELRAFIDELKVTGEQTFGPKMQEEIIVLKSADVTDPWFPGPILNGKTYGTFTKKGKCNHVIGLAGDYDDKGIVKLDQCLEEPSIILGIYSWFNYCPKCGHALGDLNRKLQGVIPDDIKTIIHRSEGVFVRDGKGNESKIPESLTLDESGKAN